MKRIATSLFCMALAAPALAHNEGGKVGILHSTATASADVEPDVARISAGVESEATTARAAMEANSALMRRVYAAIEASGIDRRDVATQYLNLSQRYDFDPQGRTRINQRYAVTNQVTVTKRDLDGAGLNNIGGVNFSVEDTEAAMNKARTEAIRKAREKAQSMASAAGVNLGDLLAVTEGSAPGTMGDEIVVTASRQSFSAAPPLAPGQRELSATVTLSYAID